jgi:hypothetical protein
MKFYSICCCHLKSTATPSVAGHTQADEFSSHTALHFSVLLMTESSRKSVTESTMNKRSRNAANRRLPANLQTFLLLGPAEQISFAFHDR